MKILKKLDFLSRSACFTFNERGETTNKTLIGGIISLISIFCSFLLCSYFLYRFFKRKETWVIHSTETNDFINNTLSHKMPILLRLSDTKSYEYKNADYIYNITLKVLLKMLKLKNVILKSIFQMNLKILLIKFQI